MTHLTVAALFLLGSHLGISSTGIRPRLVAAIGERAYLALYSLVALLAIVWLVTAWRAAPWIELWPASPATRHLPFLAMPFALLLVVCGLSQANPTAVGASVDVNRQEPARGILRVTRHPFMWGAALWALAHLLANGDLASVVFFGTFAVLALGGTLAIDAKRAERGEPGWAAFVAATSNLPLAAIVGGRQRFVAGEIGVARPLLAAALYVGLIFLHPWLFGVPALSG
jgi:uncharacterized membrane protein